MLDVSFFISYVQYHISAAEKYPNVNLNFNKKMSGGRVDKGELKFVE
jgi:hypothetical protein